MKKNNPIGIFDSGLGGLTVLKELKKILPKENYIYLGDTLNNPYGDKTANEIRLFARKNIEFMVKNGVKIIVVACNTASSNGLEEIAKDYDVEILNIVDCAVESIEKEKDILLLATKSTVESKYYDNKLNAKFEDINLYKVACPLIAPSVEKNNLLESEIQNIVNMYLEPYKNIKYDYVILGCTHYPVWRKNFEKILPKNVKIIDPAKSVSLKCKKYLEENNLISEKNIENNIKYFVTKDPESFNDNKNGLFPTLFSEHTEIIKL